MDLPVLGGACHKDTRARSFDSSLLLDLPAFQKRLKVGIFSLRLGSRKDARAQSLLFSLSIRLCLLLKKAQSWRFLSSVGFSQRRKGAKSFFSSGKMIIFF